MIVTFNLTILIFIAGGGVRIVKLKVAIIFLFFLFSGENKLR